MKLTDAWRAAVLMSAPLQLKHGTLQQRDFILLRFETDDKQARWTEASPLQDWSCDSLQDNINALTLLKEENLSSLVQSDVLPPALSTAVGLLLETEIGDSQEIESNTLIANDFRIIEPLKTVVKLKVGQQKFSDDIDRINHVLAHLRNDQLLRLDANQSWQLQHVEQIAERVPLFEKIEYIEEPLEAELDYADWLKFSPIAFAWDERLTWLSVSSFKKPRGLSSFVIKPTIVGWKQTHALLAFAESENIQPVISSSFESPVGLTLLKKFARKIAPKVCHGLATEAFVDCKKVEPPSPLPIDGLTRLERLV